MIVDPWWPGDATWRHRSGSTSAQGMTWCHQATSHSWTSIETCYQSGLWSSPESDFARSAHEINPEHVFGNHTCKMTTTSPRSQWINFCRIDEKCTVYTTFFLLTSLCLHYYRRLQWHHNERNGISNTSVLIVYSTVCSGTDQREHQSSMSLVPLWARGPQRLGWGAELTHTATGEW